ncbi:MAG: hypothetical protein F4X44_04345 [Gammaproteobacteria bacterium]|nr:hypothetical protein [Gammaproteobacteria bacterium]MYD79827.1 hypothetical protein [Gammaproteobacteria bacterium]
MNGHLARKPHLISVAVCLMTVFGLSIGTLCVNGEEMPSEEDRHRNMGSLMIGWIIAGKGQELFDRIEEYPTPELRAHAAMLLKANLGDSLSRRQLNKLDSYLQDETD